jgi:predicted signal transduction protein with EAL and GGDEF domain
MYAEEEIESAAPILFVDDEPESRRAFARAMRARGFNVDLADGGDQAIALAGKQQYALIAADLRMPDLDGVHLVEKLREVQPDATYILVTGVRDLDLPRSLSADSIASVIQKPWDADELADCIWRGVELHRDRQSGWSEPPTDPGVRRGMASVLLLDNDPNDPDFMPRALIEAGLPEYEVIQTNRLSDAVRLAQERDLQVIVTSLSLPDARGFDTITRLRRIAPDTPIVVVADLQDEALAVQAFRAGAQDYLVKAQLNPDLVRRTLRFAIERRRAEEKLSLRHAAMAHVDGSLFPGRLTSALSRAKRDRTRVAVLLINLARQKSESNNQRFNAELTQLVTERTRASLREYDTLAWLAENRLGVILEGIVNGDQSDVPARRMLDALAEPIILANETLQLSVNLGIALYPDDADTEEELCRFADMASCRARAAGSGVYEFFSETQQRSSQTRIALEDALKRAAAAHDFALHYEPQIQPKTNRLVAMEAKLCWPRSNQEIWTTEQFIGPLEEHGLSQQLTEWLLIQVCRQAQAWQARLPELKVSLDLSPKQFLDHELIAKLGRALSVTHLPPRSLELEIPDRVLTTPAARERLGELSEVGVRLTIDDFGKTTGLTQVVGLPLHGIKIDAGMVGKVEGAPSALARAIGELARGLKLELSAMDVRSSAQRDVLVEMGCLRAQGPFFGVAMPADDALAQGPALG